MAVTDYLVTDDLTIVLGLVAAGLFLLHNLYKPQSLVHPILLGRQSDVARVRNATESAVYRNYGTGMLGRFPLRPTKDQHVLLDLVQPDSDAPRTFWSTKITNPQLRQRVSAFGSGLVRLSGVEAHKSNVLLLLNDGIEFLIADLALASRCIPSLTLSSLSVLSPVLDHHSPEVIITQGEFLHNLLELIYDSNEDKHYTVVVVGEHSAAKTKNLAGIRILEWEHIEREGQHLDEVTPPTPDPQDVFTVSFSQNANGGLDAVRLTHENITAGVAATRVLLPTSSALSSLDTIVSAHSLSTPYGRAVAYTAVFEGTGFATLDSAKLFVVEGLTRGLQDLRTLSNYKISSPTLLFVKPEHLNSLSAAILEEARKSSFLMFSFAWRHKLAGVLEGYITKESLWDRLVFDGARVKVMGKGAGTVRAVLIGEGSLEGQALTPARIALSVPIVNVHTHSHVAGPVFASHALDLQTFATVAPNSPSQSAADAYAFTYLASVGPPSVNVEAKLVGVDDAAIEAGEDPVGTLYVRGPSVGQPLFAREENVKDEEDRGWVNTTQRAKVAPNGTVKVVSVSKA